jgi:cyclohexyl-isocyanide hydratase
LSGDFPAEARSEEKDRRHLKLIPSLPAIKSTKLKQLMTPIPSDIHLTIGGLIYPNMDQCDFTGPFEALARIPNSRFLTIWKDKHPVRDLAGLLLLADTTIDEAPQLDVLLVPGGHGQEALMHDEVVLSFIRTQAERARVVFSVCTGALLCGAAGLLQGKRATTHWTAMQALPYFGAIPSDERVVIDGKFVSAGGVTSGIDGSLVVVSLLRGETVAQELQLYMAYDPHPPFNAGSPASAPALILNTVTERAKPITQKRLETARAYQARRTHA